MQVVLALCGVARALSRQLIASAAPLYGLPAITIAPASPSSLLLFPFTSPLLHSQFDATYWLTQSCKWQFPKHSGVGMQQPPPPPAAPASLLHTPPLALHGEKVHMHWVFQYV